MTIFFHALRPSRPGAILCLKCDSHQEYSKNHCRIVKASNMSFIGDSRRRRNPHHPLKNDCALSVSVIPHTATIEAAIDVGT